MRHNVHAESHLYNALFFVYVKDPVVKIDFDELKTSAVETFSCNNIIISE